MHCPSFYVLTTVVQMTTRSLELVTDTHRHGTLVTIDAGAISHAGVDDVGRLRVRQKGTQVSALGQPVVGTDAELRQLALARYAVKLCIGTVHCTQQLQ